MRRGETGRYEVSTTAGESVRAFVPHPLPPDPPLVTEGRIQTLLEQSLLALGRLDSVSTLVPGAPLLLYTQIRREAVLSSQIEGTQSSLSDLLLFELEEAPGAPLEDVMEVSNCVAAFTHGLSRMRGGFPLCGRLLREIHAELLAGGRGSDKLPGEFRRSQNWIGGTRPGNAAFVPPPPQAVPDCMAALERFIHSPGENLPVLLRAALVHVQFETIHPFLDGNGRVGRALITLMLCLGGVLSEPALHLSLFFKRHRADYYRLLDQVRRNGDWEAWVEFFLRGVKETAEESVAMAQRIQALFEEDRARIEREGRTAGSALRVHTLLQQQPLATLRSVTERTGLSFPGATAGMRSLERMGIAREITGRARDRIFCYDRFLEILNEDMTPL